MNTLSKKMKIPGILLLVLMLFVGSASADYNFDGVPYTDKLEMVAHGTVKGGVYVDGGHGLGTTPYTQSFNVPEGTVKWARLYVGVWGGTEEKTGSIAVTFNGMELGTLELEGKYDTNPNVYCSGHGVYWIVYDVTSNTTSGPVDAVVTTSGDIDGRVYGVVLAAVYKDPDGEKVKYWINEGNVNLHGEGWSGDIQTTNDEAKAEFTGTLNVDKFAAARLTAVYLTGTHGLNDHLYFNDEKLCDGDNCDDIANSKQYFDLKTFDVTDHLDKKANRAKFERGDEDYVHPVLAVLVLKRGTEPSANQTVHLGASIRPAIAIEVTPSNIDFGELSPGETSDGSNLTVKNKGSFSINVTAEVIDSAENLFVEGMLLNDELWKLYSAVIPKNGDDKPVAKLHVPGDYAGVGSKEGTMMFWASKA